MSTEEEEEEIEKVVWSSGSDLEAYSIIGLHAKTPRMIWNVLILHTVQAGKYDVL